MGVSSPASYLSDFYAALAEVLLNITAIQWEAVIESDGGLNDAHREAAVVEFQFRRAESAYPRPIKARRLEAGHLRCELPLPSTCRDTNESDTSCSPEGVSVNQFLNHPGAVMMDESCPGGFEGGMDSGLFRTWG
jgi:hypothetical protein